MNIREHVTTDTDNARKLLGGAGRRTTRQRTVILDILNEETGHLDADEVYRLAKQRDARMSLSTVYRTLGLLKQLGQVDELHLAEEHHHYEAKGNGEHYHLVCLGCGRVVEFRSHLTDHLRAEQQAASGYTITSVQMDLAGYCPGCRAKGLAPATNDTHADPLTAPGRD